MEPQPTTIGPICPTVGVFGMNSWCWWGGDAPHPRPVSLRGQAGNSYGDDIYGAEVCIDVKKMEFLSCFCALLAGRPGRHVTLVPCPLVRL